MADSHPCLKCGACCAAFRVSFHWSEVLSESHQVPAELTTNITPHLNAMKGTDQVGPHCIALSGTVGDHVSCQIYERRPSTCRNFKASYENGMNSPHCDRARSIRGLAPLTAEDWNI
jgi:hypothetical protein